MDVSNHAYVFSVDGVYDFSNEIRDQIIRGDAIVGRERVPPRLHVTSSGNHGDWPREGGQQVGYFSLTKQVKNALVVGNLDGGTGRIASTSSLGPTHDGRIKPDVVAPGQLVKSAGSCHGRELLAEDRCFEPPNVYLQSRNFYKVDLGSSQAAAAATGVIALVLEQYAVTYAANLDERPPLPSTLRGIAIHTATDIASDTEWSRNADGPVRPTPGPDFVTGWGLINAEAATDVVRKRLLLEGEVSSTCDKRVYNFDVLPGNVAPLRVTLAWDDPAGDPKLAQQDPTAPILVNDLDVVLIGPDQSRHYPWQLDQEIVQAGKSGAVIPNEQQTCGKVISVKRQFRPELKPVFKGSKSPENRLDPIPPGGVPAALSGPDHLNNVEVVDLAAPREGIWTVEISGFNVRQGPQRFSLIGQQFRPVNPP
jgi:hypothetical protein